eukprot:COSAG02_NODE_618_length_19461_cov_39.117447_4_plen_473_part_00
MHAPMRTTVRAGQPSDWVPPKSNPLKGLPALPTMHHSYGNCQVSTTPAPNVPCPFPVDSNNEMQLDYARITHAWSVEIALGGGCCPGGMTRDGAGNTIWDPEVLDKSLNKTEIVEATKLCAKTNASISVNYSPWAYFWGGQPGLNASRTGPANRTIRDLECPPATPYACDPTVRGIDEELELRFYDTQLLAISTLIEDTNRKLGSNVQIGGILLDSERFLINTANRTQIDALTRKDQLIYNVSRRYCQLPTCTIEQYNRGTIVREATLAKPSEGIPPDDAWTPWPGTSAPSPTSPYGPSDQNSSAVDDGTTYDTYATSLYTIAEIGYTREAYTRTVANAAKAHVQHVTPWLWLGGGCRRKVDANSPGTTGCDALWDYDLAYSWMIGRELADPFYGQHPARFAPWGHARRVALFPHPFSSMGWVEKHVNASSGVVSRGEESVLSSVGLKHFVAYVLGAADIRTLNNTNATRRM